VSEANVVTLLQPGSFADPLTEVLRNGARSLLAQAVEAEVAEFRAKHSDLKTASGLSRMVRHGHLPEREVMTGIGPVGVRQPRVRDRSMAPGINTRRGTVARPTRGTFCRRPAASMAPDRHNFSAETKPARVASIPAPTGRSVRRK
jgi:hypothetical protein